MFSQEDLNLIVDMAGEISIDPRFAAYGKLTDILKSMTVPCGENLTVQFEFAVKRYVLRIIAAFSETPISPMHYLKEMHAIQMALQFKPRAEQSAIFTVLSGNVWIQTERSNPFHELVIRPLRDKVQQVLLQKHFEERLRHGIQKSAQREFQKIMTTFEDELLVARTLADPEERAREELVSCISLGLRDYSLADRYDPEAVSNEDLVTSISLGFRGCHAC